MYVAKLEELKREGDAIERRASEQTARGPAAASLTALAGSYASAATSTFGASLVNVLLV